MKITIEIDPENISQTRSHVHVMKENLVDMAVINESPVKNPEELLWYLRVLASTDELLLKIANEID